MFPLGNTSHPIESTSATSRVDPVVQPFSTETAQLIMEAAINKKQRWHSATLSWQRIDEVHNANNGREKGRREDDTPNDNFSGEIIRPVITSEIRTDNTGEYKHNNRRKCTTDDDEDSSWTPMKPLPVWFLHNPSKPRKKKYFRSQQSR